MALFSISNSCLAIIGMFALSTAACASGSDDNNNVTTNDDDDSGTGGQTGDDDDSGTGGSTTAPPTYLYTFSEITDINAALPANATPVENDLTPDTKFTMDDQDGAPAESDAPSMKIVAPFSEFTSPDQAVDFQFQLEGAPVDLTGKTVIMYFKFDDGFVQDPTAPGGVIFYAKSGPDWNWGANSWKNLEVGMKGKWQKISFKLANAEPGSADKPFDPSQVMSIGVKIDTGEPRETPESQPTEGTFHIDSIGFVDDAPTP